MNKIAIGLMITVGFLNAPSVSTIVDMMLKSGNTMRQDHTCWKGNYTMRINRWLLTVHYKNIPKTTYMFFHIGSALKAASIIKQSNPDLIINLIRKELTIERCEAVLSTGNLPT